MKQHDGKIEEEKENRDRKPTDNNSRKRKETSHETTTRNNSASKQTSVSSMFSSSKSSRFVSSTPTKQTPSKSNHSTSKSSTPSKSVKSSTPSKSAQPKLVEYPTEREQVDWKELPDIDDFKYRAKPIENQQPAAPTANTAQVHPISADKVPKELKNLKSEFQLCQPATTSNRRIARFVDKDLALSDIGIVAKMINEDEYEAFCIQFEARAEARPTRVRNVDNVDDVWSKHILTEYNKSNSCWHGAFEQQGLVLKKVEKCYRLVSSIFAVDSWFSLRASCLSKS